MTDEMNQRNTLETDLDQTVNNPVDELARIMGYNHDQVQDGEPVIGEASTAADLEAELMREFGIESLDVQPETPVEQAAVTEQVANAELAVVARQPVEQPNYQPEIEADDVLEEMAKYNVPNPVEQAAPTPVAPVAGANAPLPSDNFVVDDNFASDLELELARLQQGLSGDMSADAVADGISQPSPPVAQTPVPEPLPPEPLLARHVEQAPPIAADVAHSAVDMSAVIETDGDVEQTAEFDIPSVDPIDVATSPEAEFDVDLDSELEREFSQMFADENLRGDVADQELTAAEEITPESEPNVSSFFDMSAMNEEDRTDDLPQAGAVPVLLQPERIDVSQNQSDGQDLQAAQVAGGSNTGKFAAVGLFAILILGVGGYFIYNNLASDGTGSNEPILVKADNSPIKVEPDDPGGLSVPNQDKAVYNQVEGNDTSIANQPSLVQATEEPVDIVQRTLDPNLLPLEGRGTADKVEDRLVSGDQAIVGGNDGGTRPLITPKKVRTVVVQADGTIITREAPATGEASGTEQIAQADAQQADQSFSNQDAISQPLIDQLAAATVDPDVAVSAATGDNTAAAVPTPIATPAPATVAQPETQVAAQTQVPAQPVENFSGYYMQIASQPSLAAAQSSYRNLANRYNSVLGGRGVEYQKADIAGKGTFHRVRIQVGSRSEANSLCSRYKTAGGSCFVTR